MKKLLLGVGFAATTLAVFAATSMTRSNLTEGFKKGDPGITAMGTLEFGPEGILFIGDQKAGAIFAVDLGDNGKSDAEEPPQVEDIESQIAAMLGTTADEILIHDLAVHPTSLNTYLTVSRGRGAWDSRWKIPNDLSDARILIRVTPAGELEAVDLDNVSYARADLPNPVEDRAHQWKEGVSVRTETITDVVYDNGTVYVAGLSNEEFASTLWRVSFPFAAEPEFTTLEIFHGAHGKWETGSPIRTLLPYSYGGKQHILASYLCTPLVTFPLDDLKDGEHVKGKTVAEFGSGNFPLDMVLYQKDGKDRVLMANSFLPLLVFDPLDAEAQEPITTEVEGYLEGVRYEARSGSGVQQIDNFNADFIVSLQRMPSGKMNLSYLRIPWL
jgi:hypothetical protein